MTTSLNTGQLVLTSAGLTTATTAYTDGDQLGTLITALGSGNPAGYLITDVTLVDKANILGAAELFLFDRSVTLAADNAAGPAVSGAHALFSQGTIQLPYPSLAGNNRISGIDSIARIVRPNVPANGFFIALVTRSSHTFFGAAGDIQLTIHYSADV